MGSLCGNKCLVCGGEAEVYTEDSNHNFVKCNTCGRYAINTYEGKYETKPTNFNRLASYLYYNGKINQPIVADQNDFFNFIGMKAKFDSIFENNPYCFHVTNDIVNNWYPRSFNEKIDVFLLGLIQRLNFLSEVILFTDDQIDSACFVIRKPEGPMSTDKYVVQNQRDYFIDYLKDQKYIERYHSGFQILPNGLKRIDELQKKQEKDSKTVFVAMSFAAAMKDIREAIKDAITASGYIPRIMDEVEHNHQIVPEMLYEIKMARFVVAELTGHNNGAYFEAGYALGMGKEVIQLCCGDKFGTDGHFDVKQINTILWNTTDELRERLIQRIKATIA